MPLTGSGQISLSDIAEEFEGSAPHALSEYYNKGNAPSSGEIQLAADFYGTSNVLDGSTSALANVSAAAIKTATGTTTNGLYWIAPSGITAFQVYCNMNIDGGIMLLMKLNSGSSGLGENSSHWTSNSLLNDGTPNTTVNGDYKYQSARDIPISNIYVTDSSATNGYKYTLGQTVTGIHNIWGGTNTGISAHSGIGNGVSDSGNHLQTGGWNYGGHASNSGWHKNSSSVSNGNWYGKARLGRTSAHDQGPWPSVHGEARGIGLRADHYGPGVATTYRSSVADQIIWGK
jgi:hypothetical protein